MFWWLTQHLATTALLFVIVWLVCRLLRRRPAVSHLLWLVVLLKLLTPPFFAWSLPEIQIEPLYATAGSETATASPAVPETFPLPLPPSKPARMLADEHPFTKEPPPKDLVAKKPAPEPRIDDSEQPPAPKTSTVVKAVSLSPPEPVESSPAPSFWSWEELLISLWIIGGLGMAILQCSRVFRFQRRLRQDQPPRWLIRMVRELAAKLEVTPPPVRLVAGLLTPAIWSLGRPQLLWPAELLERFDSQRCHGMVAHELAHLRRRDHWIAHLLLLADCLWWWNPLYWLTRRELQHSAEWACDAWVVWALPEERRSYAEALIDVSRSFSHAALPAPALGIGGARRAFQRRLTMIMCEQVPCRVSRWALVAIGLAALAVLPGWARAQTRELQDTVNTNLDTARLKQTLAKLEEQKKTLEAEIEVLKKHIDALKEQSSVIHGAEGRIKELQATVVEYKDKLTLLQQAREHYLKRDATNTGRAIDALIVSQDSLIDSSTSGSAKRPWGPEQATGAPDCGDTPADNQKAWASLTEDGQDEWLTLAYEPAVQPMAILVYENYNPGALYKVSVFAPGSSGESLEREVWKGNDPTPPGSGRGVSLIPVKVNEKITHVKLYLRSTQVKGWNEIDAVGLLDSEGKIHWAVRAEASSTYADQQSRAVQDLSRWISDRTVVGEPYSTMRRARDDQRLDRLERDVKELKEMLQKLVGQQNTAPVLPPPIEGPDPISEANLNAEIHRLLKQNEEVQHRLKELEQRKRKPEKQQP